MLGSPTEIAAWNGALAMGLCYSSFKTHNYFCFVLLASALSGKLATKLNMILLQHAEGTVIALGAVP